MKCIYDGGQVTKIDESDITGYKVYYSNEEIEIIPNVIFQKKCEIYKKVIDLVVISCGRLFVSCVVFSGLCIN